MATWRTVRPLSILCFDIENLPGTYGPGDWTHPKVTAIAGQFVGDPPPRAWVLDRRNREQMTQCAISFAELWGEADRVMGHNIRRHDIKILGGLYTDLGLPLLPKKRMIDTYLDQPKMQGVSRSLENLADRWDCPIKKLHLSEYAWQMAYDGIPEYAEQMRARVTSDVQINLWLFEELLRRELLSVS